jgi:hypothetical protein
MRFGIAPLSRRSFLLARDYQILSDSVEQPWAMDEACATAVATETTQKF